MLWSRVDWKINITIRWFASLPQTKKKDQQKKEKKKKHLFCTAVRQMLISQVLSDSKYVLKK